MKTKLFGVLALLLAGLIAVSGLVSAGSVPVTIQKVFINDMEVVDGELRGDIVRNDKIDVDVKLLATGDDDYVTVEATVEGLEHDRSKATDKTDVFSVKAGQVYYKKLSIQLPERMDTEEYALRIEVSNRKDAEVVYSARLYVNAVRHGVDVKDVIFSPTGEVKAGYSLITNVRVKNIGQRTEDGVKITVSMPELGVSDSDYIDELEAGETKTSEDIYFRIPATAKSGDYKVKIDVAYDDGDKVKSVEKVITVKGEETATESDKTIIAVGSEAQDVVAGESGVVYPITLSNAGTASKTYTITANAGDWADVKITPNVVVLGAGETKIVYVSVAAKENAAVGAQTFGVTVSSDNKVLKEVVLNANVVAGESNTVAVLEIVLVVLVVVLVVLGLFIGFSRMKKNESTEEGQTYY